jgi:two-component system chemotaxis response regulator CheY
MTQKRVLSVGQCGADHMSISWALQRAYAAEVVAAATAPEALDRLQREEFALVLVNRIFDADGSSGLDLVRRVAADAARPVPVMLVSNYADAQEQAVAAGAVPGFGKATVGRPVMLARVAPYLKSADG